MRLKMTKRKQPVGLPGAGIDLGAELLARTPAFISRTDARSSAPRSIPAPGSPTGCFLLVIFNLILYLTKHVRGDIFLNRFVVHNQEPYLTIAEAVVVNHSHTAALSSTCVSPTNFAQSSRS